MMDASYKDPNPEAGRLDEPELDLYTIPIYSSWFSWDDIHETERLALKEFFDGSSISRTPKIYNEYRDFIINKFREDPSRRLAFTDVRKSLVGDVSLLHKVFTFLEKWGLINFGLASSGEGAENDERVRVEDGPPNGVRVLATPNSLRPMAVPPPSGAGRGTVEDAVKLPPLSSYSDAFGDLKSPHCGSCGDGFDSSGYYEYSEGNFMICVKCYGSGNYGENKSKEAFKFNETSDHKDGIRVTWTDAETLLLLDSVLKHGDNWDLVAQNVQTKNKLDCISKLIEMPFGEHLMVSRGIGGSNGAIANLNNVKQSSDPPPKHQLVIETGDGSSGSSANMDPVKEASDSSPQHKETIKIDNEEQAQKKSDEAKLNGDVQDEEPLLKRQRIAVLPDAGISLMKQVAHMSRMVASHVTAAAADAAVTAICEETVFPKEIFYDDVDIVADGFLQSSGQLNGLKSEHQDQDAEMKEASTSSEIQDSLGKENEVPTPLRIRVAAATALGAAAANAKLLAVQERREIDNLVATIIDAQMKKLHSKLKHLDELEVMMEKERNVMDELKEDIVEEWVDLLRTGLDSGVSRWRDHACVKPQTSNVA